MSENPHGREELMESLNRCMNAQNALIIERNTLRSRVEELEKQLAAFAPFAGPDGEPRKVLGKLQVTADHCIVGDDLAIELFNEKGDRLNTIGNGMARGPVVFCSDTGERFRLSYPFHKCYSTPAAAQSAKESQ